LGNRLHLEPRILEYPDGSRVDVLQEERFHGGHYTIRSHRSDPFSLAGHHYVKCEDPDRGERIPRNVRLATGFKKDDARKGRSPPGSDGLKKEIPIGFSGPIGT
jgi:hypothetical protein